MRIKDIKDSLEVKPGMKLYLGNKFDIINNTKLGIYLDRTSKEKNIEYVVPKDISEENLELLKDMIKERILSINKLDGISRFFRGKVVEEAKSFTYKPISKMTYSELKYLASKIGLNVDRRARREEILSMVEDKLEDKGHNSRKKNKLYGRDT